MTKIKEGDKFIAKRDGGRLLSKGDKIIITAIKKGSYNSLEFYGTINGRKATDNQPFELVDLETAIGL